MLKLKHIQKSFGANQVLKGIDLEVQPGEALGLVGENGAGKSTLMNILAGVFPPSAGELFWKSQPYTPHSPKDALAEGIAIIHQELNLFPNLSIRENLFINELSPSNGFWKYRVSWKELDQKAKQLLDQVGLQVAPRIQVGELTNAQQQLVEIAKALGSAPELIIFDEPTTALSRHESERLFDIIKELKKRKIGIIYISHTLEDVLRVSDQIAVLRDGDLVSNGPRKDYTKASMVREMVGRELDQFFPARQVQVQEEAILDIDGLSSHSVTDISLSIHKKEVLGLYGLVGAGRSELARAIYGLDPQFKGTLRWKGKPVSSVTPVDWIRKGLVFLTEDRREEGLLLSKGIQQNVRLAALPTYANSIGGWINFQAANQQVNQYAQTTRIKCDSLENQEVRTLSGGNQQKVVLSKWLMTQPELLIMDEPTKGIDIGAKKEIYSLINQLVEQGSSVWFISSEIEELLGMCDRIIVMGEGRVKKTFDRSQWDSNAMLAAALPDFSTHTSSHEK